MADKALRKRYPEDRAVGVTCRNHAVENGLVMRAVGDIMVLSPPRIISEAEIVEIAGRARRALDLTARDLGL